MALITVLLGILLLVVLLLFIPLEVEYHFDNRVMPTHTVGIRWLYGLVFLRLGSGGQRDIESNHKGQDRQKALEQVILASTGEKARYERQTKSGKKNVAFFLEVMGSDGFVRRLFQLIYELLTVAKIKSLRLRLYFGLDDPADTGLLCALLMPTLSPFYAISRVDMVAQPVFDRAILRANLYVHIHLVPINYLRAIARFLLSKANLGVVLLLLKQRWA